MESGWELWHGGLKKKKIKGNCFSVGWRKMDKGIRGFFFFFLKRGSEKLKRGGEEKNKRCGRKKGRDIIRPISQKKKKFLFKKIHYLNCSVKMDT